MWDWIKNNSTAVVWMVAATLLGLALPSFTGTAAPTMLDHIGGAGVGLVTSAYFALYLYAGPSGMAALWRLLPAVVIAAIAGALWYAGFVFPGYLLSGVFAASMSLYVAAAIGPLLKKNS